MYAASDRLGDPDDLLRLELVYDATTDTNFSSHIFVDSVVAANVPTGGVADLDSDGVVLGVIDHAGGQSHLTLFTMNTFGELTPTTLFRRCS
jgi:hypothetical protein